MRRAICGLTAKNLNGMFQRITARFRRDGASLDGFMEAFADQSGPAVRFPSDDELRTAMISAPIHKTFIKGERLQDVLWELEVASRGRFAEAMARPSSLWVEHVMPQSRRTHWPLPETPAEGETESPEAQRRERLIHTIGNLTLTTDQLNIALGNGMFESKRASLDASLLALNKWFTSRGEWNEPAIEER